MRPLVMDAFIHPLRAAACLGLVALAPLVAQAQTYPLCPGASWSSATPLVAVAPAAPASATRSLRDVLAAASASSGARGAPRPDVAITASAARRNLDPLTYRAYFGDEAGPADLPAMPLPDALKGLRNLDDTKGMVAPGGRTPPGGLDDVPANVPVALGVDAAGKPCVRPATVADWRLDTRTNQVSRVWDPKGFADVGLLVKFDPAAPKRFETCTVTRVAPGFAVTSAHCVIDSTRGQAIALRDYAGAGARSLVLTPRFNDEKPDILGCFTHPQACGYDVSTPLARATLRPGTQWPDGADAPVPDVALLAIAFNPHIPETISGIAAQAAPSRLTIAGYGHTDAASAKTWGDLLVGWQQSVTSVDDKSLAWTVDIVDGRAGVCAGDSGGPVYLGDFAGLRGENKQIGGVVSTRSAPGVADSASEEAMKCTRSGTNQAARLDTELAWICPAGKGTVKGCPGAH